MIFTITAEDIERAERLMRDPFESDEVRLFFYPEPIASDDGLFKHRDEYATCFGCQPDPSTGEMSSHHAHLVLQGANGGVRCEPLRLSTLAQYRLSRWRDAAVERLVETGLLFPDD
jgi:hypothetical protein